MLPSSHRFPAVAALAFLCLGAGPGGFPGLGKSRTEIEGCLAKTRAPAPTKPTDKTKDTGHDVQVDVRRAGIVVTHALRHAGCLQGAVRTSVDRGVIALAVTLSGTPCRHLCQSTLTTAIGLSSGSYRLRITVTAHGSSWTAHESTVTVR